MTSFYLFMQWARPAWLLIIMASAISVGMLLTVLSVIHNWLADQFFIMDEVSPADEDRPDTAFEIPVHFHSSDAA